MVCQRLNLKLLTETPNTRVLLFPLHFTADPQAVGLKPLLLKGIVSMKINKRDWMFIALVVVVPGIIFVISGKVKTTPMPNNQIHKIVYDAAFRNAPGPDASIFKRAFYKPDERKAEEYCEPCHKEKGVPFPPTHPSKNRCLLCHKLKH